MCSAKTVFQMEETFMDTTEEWPLSWWIETSGLQNWRQGRAALVLHFNPRAVKTTLSLSTKVNSNYPESLCLSYPLILSTCRNSIPPLGFTSNAYYSMKPLFLNVRTLEPLWFSDAVLLTSLSHLWLQSLISDALLSSKWVRVSLMSLRISDSKHSVLWQNSS